MLCRRGAVLAGLAPDKLLDSYEEERIGFARRLVATTDRVFSFVTAEGRIADIIRTRVAPVLIPTAMAFEATFVPATVFDNPALLRVNPQYLAWLLSLPTLERERLLAGNWKIRPAAGLYFKRE
jgi:hypothetical protein